MVSVIIPTYNRADFVLEAIESVLSQTFINFELIVVDDGSTDTTIEQIQSKFSSRLNLISQSNRGVSAARNTGIQNSKGDWIAFLDSDDYWLPKKLEVQVEYLQKNPSVLMCQTEEIWIRDRKRVNPKKKHQKYSGYIFEQCLPLCIVSPSSVIIKRELLDRVGGFDTDLPACEDYDLWLRIAKDYPIYFLNEPLIVKRGGHGNQLSQKYWGMDRFRVQALIKLLESNTLDQHQKEITLSELEKKCNILIQGFLKRGNRTDAEKYENLKQKDWETRQELNSKI
ncbi:MAG: glycosyltransferase [Leptospiraceae bacterium]|nr:glycosyltransferase [Leptospiraceae bacterium]